MLRFEIPTASLRAQRSNPVCDGDKNGLLRSARNDGERRDPKCACAPSRRARARVVEEGYCCALKFPPRHCERSEAIQSPSRRPLDCFAALAMTTKDEIRNALPAPSPDKKLFEEGDVFTPKFDAQGPDRLRHDRGFDRRDPDARRCQRTRVGKKRWRPASPITGRARGKCCGARATPPGRCSGWWTSARTATRTPLLLRVTAGGDGKACHTGRKSCFYRRVEQRPATARASSSIKPRGPERETGRIRRAAFRSGGPVRSPIAAPARPIRPIDARRCALPRSPCSIPRSGPRSPAHSGRFRASPRPCEATEAAIAEANGR